MLWQSSEQFESLRRQSSDIQRIRQSKIKSGWTCRGYIIHGKDNVTMPEVVHEILQIIAEYRISSTFPFSLRDLATREQILFAFEIPADSYPR